jgi:hypothetical protein
MNNKILAIGRYNGFVIRSISELADYSNLDAIVLFKKENLVFPSNVKNIKAFKLVNFLSIIKFYYYIFKNRNKYDGFIFYYMQEYFYALLILNIIKKATYYFPFGSDLHKSGVNKFLMKKSLKNFNNIFVELETQKQYIIDNYKVPKKKIETSFVIFNVDSCFYRFEEEQKVKLREKWGISKKYIAISPRTLKDHYNHHKVIEGIGKLKYEIRNNLELVIIGNGQNDYLQKLLDLAKQLNVHIKHINKYVSAEEMAEIQNISDININIPAHDQFGHSIIEGCLCGSVPLLSSKISNYHEFMKENTNCIYTNELPHDLALRIEQIISNFPTIKDKFYKENIIKLSIFTNREKNSEKLVNYLINNYNDTNKK